MIVVVDTNFLILMFTKKIDIFENINYLAPKSKTVVLDIVLDEIKKVKPHMYESVLSLLKIKKIKVTSSKTKMKVDDFILDYAFKNKGIVATLDRELKQKALNQGIQIISVKGNELQLR